MITLIIILLIITTICTMGILVHVSKREDFKTYHLSPEYIRIIAGLHAILILVMIFIMLIYKHK